MTEATEARLRQIIELSRRMDTPTNSMIRELAERALTDITSSTTPPRPAWSEPEELAQQFHEAYERLAPSFGYKTRDDSRKPWADVPDQNKRLMIAVCAELLSRRQQEIAQLRGECETALTNSVGLVNQLRTQQQEIDTLRLLLTDMQKLFAAGALCCQRRQSLGAPRAEGGVMAVDHIEQLPKAKPLGQGGGGSADMSWWKKVPPRDPLPPFPGITSSQQSAVWAEEKYATTPARVIPDHPDVDFYRARFNGIVCKDIPRSRWNYPNNPDKMMTWDLPWYSLKDQNTYLDIYQYQYGLTHVILTMPFAYNPNDVGTDQGCLDQRFVDCAANIARRGMFVCCVLRDERIPQELVEDIWRRMIAAKAVHRVIVAWQADKAIDPLPLFDMLCWAKLFALKNCPDVRVDMHWLRDPAAWWDAKPEVPGVPDEGSPRVPNDTFTQYGVYDRATYYHATGYPEWTSENGKRYIDRICARLGEEYRLLDGKAILNASLLQYDVNAPIDNLQEALLSLWKEGVGIPPGRTNVVAGEYEAQAESDNDVFPPRLPWCGDTKGFLMLAVSASEGRVVCGFTDGGLWPDGRIL